jgi:F-type H+-transporting ATPase subunit b
MLTFPPDISFLIQIASFLVLWFALKRLLFDPVLHVLEEREARTTGARKQAAADRAQADLSAAEYERRMHDVRLALVADAEAARNAARAEERRVVTEARDHANAQLTRLRESLAAQVQAAAPVVTAEAEGLAARIVEQVVGRPLA